MKIENSQVALAGKVYEKTGSLVTRRIAGELILVPISGDLANLQRIFTLTPVAEFIWERLDKKRDLIGIRDDVVARFDVESSQADADIFAFIEKLINARLIKEVEK